MHGSGKAQKGKLRLTGAPEAKVLHHVESNPWAKSSVILIPFFCIVIRGIADVIFSMCLLSMSERDNMTR